MSEPRGDRPVARGGPRRAAVLAVDGGNSKTDVALLDSRGRVLGVARGTGSSQQTSGVEGSSASLVATVQRACDVAGIDPSARPVAGVGVYCMAGVDLPVDERRVATAVRFLALSESDVVLNDTFAVLRAGTDRGWGVAVVCGAGMNCLGLSPAGRTVRFPALGAISGDWGSGLSLGMAALGAAVRARDGRGERTILEHTVPAHFDLTRPSAVTDAIYLGRLPETRLMELPPLVFAASRDGDAVAAGIVNRLADEVVAMAGAAIRRLGMRRLDVDVVLGGGMFRSDDERLLSHIREGLRAVAPHARAVNLGAPPVLGAALIGMDRLRGGSNDGAGSNDGDGHGRPGRDPVAARVRAGLTHETMRGGPAAPARAKDRKG
jgi:N-acetylglucosamine kinase-like BadF-type ATPase